MFKDLPPSSRGTGTSVFAAVAAMACSVGTLPVKLIRSGPGWPRSAAPARGPPVTTFKC
jgi:hypothetical protein